MHDSEPIIPTKMNLVEETLLADFEALEVEYACTDAEESYL